MQDYIIETVFTPEEADRFRTDLDSICKMREGSVGHGGKSVVDDNIRQSPVGWPDPNHELVKDRFTALRRSIMTWNAERFKFAVDPDSFEWQFTRYGRGGDFYNQHCDCAYVNDRGGKMRKLSGSLLLTNPSDIRGGSFRFTQGVSAIRPLAQGEIVVFCSFLPHSVSPIITGTRESLVFWLSGPDFK